MHFNWNVCKRNSIAPTHYHLRFLYFSISRHSLSIYNIFPYCVHRNRFSTRIISTEEQHSNKGMAAKVVGCECMRCLSTQQQQFFQIQYWKSGNWKYYAVLFVFWEWTWVDPLDTLRGIIKPDMVHPEGSLKATSNTTTDSISYI